MIKLPSASGLQAAIECSGSMFLPADLEASSPEAERGTDIHQKMLGWLENDGPIAREFEFNDDLKYYVESADKALGELAWSLNLESGESSVIGYDVGRAYGEIKPGTIYGSIDLFLEFRDKIMLIDYKTGHSFVEHPSRNYQIITHALIARSQFPGVRIVGGICKPGEALQLHEFTEGELDAFTDRLSDLAETSKEKSKLVTGRHCQYCRAYNHCPQQNAILKRLSDGDAMQVSDTFEVTPENAGQVAEKVLVYEIALKKAKDKLQEYVDKNGPVPLPSGKSYGCVVSEKEAINSAEASEYFAKQGLMPQDCGASFRFSKSGIKERLGATEARRHLEGLRASGAIKKYHTFSYRPLVSKETVKEGKLRLLESDGEE